MNASTKFIEDNLTLVENRLSYSTTLIIVHVRHLICNHLIIATLCVTVQCSEFTLAKLCSAIVIIMFYSILISLNWTKMFHEIFIIPISRLTVL